MPSLVPDIKKVSVKPKCFGAKTQECFDLGAAGQSRLMLLEMCGSIDFLNDWLESMVMAVQHANLDKEFLCAGSCNLCCYTREFGRHRVKIAGNYVLYQLDRRLLGAQLTAWSFCPRRPPISLTLHRRCWEGHMGLEHRWAMYAYATFGK